MTALFLLAGTSLMFVNPNSVETSNVQGIKGHKAARFGVGTKGTESSSLWTWVGKPGTKRQGGREWRRPSHAPGEEEESSFCQGSYNLFNKDSNLSSGEEGRKS